jgi:hypothetical protein
VAESRGHRQLVRGLIRHMLGSGVQIIAAAAPGWPAPPLIGGRRPDVVGYYPVGAALMAGEAKQGPELWSSRHQLRDIAAALPAHGPAGAGALLILAVSDPWAGDARNFCDHLATGRTSATVWSPAESL